MYIDRLIDKEIFDIKKDPFHQDYIGQTLINPDKVLQTELASEGLDAYEDLLADYQVGACLDRRCLSVNSLDVNIQPFDDSVEAIRQHEIVKQIIEKINLAEISAGLMVGLLTGFKCAEIINKKMIINGAEYIGVENIKLRYSRNFVYDTDYNLRLLTTEDMINGILLPKRKFLIFRHDVSTSSVYGSGLGRTLYWLVWFKKNALKFWNIFIGKHAIPTLLAHYADGDTVTKEVLLEAIQTIQNEAGIVAPESAKIEALKIESGNNEIFNKFIEIMDRAISKRILGHASGLDATAGRLGNETMANDTMNMYTEADALHLEKIYNEQLITWLHEINFVTPKPCKFCYVWEDTEDLYKRAQTDELLLKMGVKFTNEYFAEAYKRDIKYFQSVPQPVPQLASSPFDNQFAEPLTEPQKDEKKKTDIGMEKFKTIEELMTIIDEYADIELRKIGDLMPAMMKPLLNAVKKDVNSVYNASLMDVIEAQAITDILNKLTMLGFGLGYTKKAISKKDFEALRFDDAINFFKQKTDRIDWWNVHRQEHVRNFAVVGAYKADVLQALRDGLTEALENGLTKNEFVASIGQYLVNSGYIGGFGLETPSRLDTIFRTNIMSALNVGHYMEMNSAEMQAKYPYIRYIAVLDNRTRLDHRKWHGIILPRTDPFWRTHTPTNGYNCRCTFQFVNNDDLAQYGWSVTPASDEKIKIEYETVKYHGVQVQKIKGIDIGFNYNAGAEYARTGAYRDHTKNKQWDSDIAIKVESQAIR